MPCYHLRITFTAHDGEPVNRLLGGLHPQRYRNAADAHDAWRAALITLQVAAEAGTLSDPEVTVEEAPRDAD